jgi:hypothetical protein
MALALAARKAKQAMGLSGMPEIVASLGYVHFY